MVLFCTVFFFVVCTVGFVRSFSVTMKTTSPPFRLGYVTDVEGDWDYFSAYVERSNVLDFDGSGKALSLRDGCYFVFGGDAVDKGPGDIRLCRALVSLKKLYPHRVYLLVGNRDLNKLRFAAELSDEDMARNIEEIPKPHWDPSAPTLREFLEGVAENECVQDIEAVNTRVNRLKYMLLHTLGCPETFQHRRTELAILLGEEEGNVSDEQVLQSFQQEMEKGGSLRDYLDHACVVAVVGNTLFAHGAVDTDTMKFFPALDSKFENPSSCPEPGAIIDDLYEWVDAMNRFLREGMRDYTERPLWNSARISRGGEALMALQNRPAMWGRSIISNCYGDGGCIHTPEASSVRADALARGNDPLKFEGLSSDPTDPAPSQWMLQHGIQRVIVGHKPTGDCPAVLSASYTGVEIVSADTSYSGRNGKGAFGRFRGDAIPIVEIAGPSAMNNNLEISGLLGCGTEYFCAFPRLSLVTEIDESVGDPILGRRLPDGWWVKAGISSHYHLCRGVGRIVHYEQRLKVEVERILESG